MLFPLTFFLKLITAKNYAILANLSQNISNYRHYSNISCLYELLKHHKYNDSDIILFQHQDIANSTKNEQRGQLIALKGKKHPAIKLKPEKKLTLGTLCNALKGNNRKLLDMDKESKIFIYMCGHACEEFFKIHNKELLYPKNLTNCLNKLSKLVGEIFIILDTCHAESLVEKKLEDNIGVLFTSLKDEESVSSTFNNKIGVYTIDNFPMMFREKIKESEKLSDLIENVCFKELESSLKLKGKDIKLQNYFN